MANNPLAGLRIPGIKQMVAEAVDTLPKKSVALSNAIVRQSLKDHLERVLGFEFHMEMERALTAATERAIKHVVATMRDEHYQDKKAAIRKHVAERKALKAAKVAALSKPAAKPFLIAGPKDVIQ